MFPDLEGLGTFTRVYTLAVCLSLGYACVHSAVPSYSWTQLAEFGRKMCYKEDSVPWEYTSNTYGTPYIYNYIYI